MSMEKYGVSDRAQLQRKELAKIRAKIGKLRDSDEKTAAVSDELAKLHSRETDILVALAEQ